MHRDHLKRPDSPGMPVRTRSCRETGAATDAHSPAIEGTQDSAHWGQPSPPHAHTGRQTCGRSLATPAHTALGNPPKLNKERHLSLLLSNYRTTKYFVIVLRFVTITLCCTLPLST